MSKIATLDQRINTAARTSMGIRSLRPWQRKAIKAFVRVCRREGNFQSSGKTTAIHVLRELDCMGNLTQNGGAA